MVDRLLPDFAAILWQVFHFFLFANGLKGLLALKGVLNMSQGRISSSFNGILVEHFVT